ncbi:hypothetical protein [Cupriavidus sp. TMH.W2]|uniref:hypothetical protein n=1 Tax=Cupriavidus sp. TMH.W2 TaxID=3434465 RepID=UPI003D77A7EF
MPRQPCLASRASLRRHAAMCRTFAPIAVLLTAFLAPISAASAQTLAQSPAMADSVVSRLVAWRARTDAPVALPALTSFDWDTFSVTDAPAGDGVAHCGRAGLMPCGPQLQPQPGDRVQVLRFDRAGAQVYTERIMAADGAFAEPLPRQVRRAAATLVSCPGAQGRQLWCLQGKARGRGALRQPQPFLDGA